MSPSRPPGPPARTVFPRTSPSVLADDGDALTFCTTCAFSQACLSEGMDKSALMDLHVLVEHVGPLHAGEHVFREGDAFGAIAAVRAGTVKTYVIDRDGREHVLGFHLPGEVIGLDAIDGETTAEFAGVAAHLEAVAGERRDVDEGAGRHDAPLAAHHAVDPARERKGHQLVRMIVQLRSGAGALGHHAEIHVLAFDDRTLRRRKVRIEAMRFEVLEAVKRHGESLAFHADPLHSSL